MNLIDIKERLKQGGIEDFAFEAKLIYEFTQNNDELERIIAKRLTRYPLQYILGEWGFYKYSFKVGEGVLIPRSDTEILVETACKYLKTKQNSAVLDLCAGSGCIGLSIAKDFPDSKVTLVEKSEDALKYLSQNVEFLDIKNAKVIKGDIFQGDGTGCYDLIVSNPPYIPPCEMTIISPETEFEPKTALLGGEDGLKFYRAIIKKYKQFLKKGGMLAFEVGINEDKAVCELLENAGFKNITVTKDYNGINRVVNGGI